MAASHPLTATPPRASARTSAVADRRRTAPPRTPRRPSPHPSAAWRRPARRSGLRLAADATCLAFALLAAASLLVPASSAVRWLAWVGSVLVAAAAALLALGAAEYAPGGIHQAQRWQLQAVAAAALMFMLMAAGPTRTTLEPPALFLAGGAAGALLGTAAVYRAGPRWLARSLYLALDAGVVAVATTLATVALGSSATAAGLLGMMVAAGFAIAIVTRGAAHADLASPDALLLAGVALFVAQVGAEAASHSGWPGPGFLAGPGVALLGALCLARSAWMGVQPTASQPPARPADNSRLRLAPAVAAGAAIAQISFNELTGAGTRIGFFGVVGLFGLIVGRLLLTLVENRVLLQRVERSGVFEEKLRDLGTRVVAAQDRHTQLELVCRTAQHVLGADSVLLWMVDANNRELEAVEGLSPKRASLLGRRLSLDDPTSLAARVVRTGEAEFVQHAATAGQSNGFLNVLLRAQALLAVPIAHGSAVQGVLVCVDSHDETAYGPGEQQKAELLASQVAVALDNAYQHALQRRRLEELSALYQFAQSAHVAMSGSEIVQQLLPILKHRLDYSYALVWLREGTSASLRLVAGSGPNGEQPLGGV
jgi:GAF domain